LNKCQKCILNGFIEEEVYVRQPLHFEDHTLPDHVFKLQKDFVWFETGTLCLVDKLNSFLLENGFMSVKVDTILFRREVGKDFIIVQIYVDDIIFGATNESLCKEFSDVIKSEFEMSMMGELKFFLGLQIKQDSKGIYIHQQNYTR